MDRLRVAQNQSGCAFTVEQCEQTLIKQGFELGAVVHSCNPSTWEENMGRTVVQGQSKQIVSEIPSHSIS
jgi:hypothetical protein